MGGGEPRPWEARRHRRATGCRVGWPRGRRRQPALAGIGPAAVLPRGGGGREGIEREMGSGESDRWRGGSGWFSSGALGQRGGGWSDQWKGEGALPLGVV